MDTATESWHGTLSGYTNKKCRCNLCTEAMLNYNRNYRAANKEKLNDQQRARYAADPDRMCAYQKVHREKYPEKTRARVDRYQASNKDLIREREKSYRKNNAAKILIKNARRRAILADVPTVPFTAEQLDQKWSYYGHCCWMCGSAEITTMDHVKPISLGGAHMLANLRPACSSCNSRKGAKWPLVGAL